MPVALQRQSGSDGHATIAVMGATGTGKSTFVNLASGSNFGVGNGLRSCTAAVNHSPTFDVDGVQVTLIDTPGFDDTVATDSDILRMIAIYLSSAFEQDNKLTGIIYMHNIASHRMTGISRQNFQMFKKLCGDASLSSVVVVTTMWSNIMKGIGDARELELRTDKQFFKPILDGGAQMCRHDNNRGSALNILRHLITKKPVTLRIQQELIMENKDIMDTEAGEQLGRELLKERKRHQGEMAALRRQMEEALHKKDMQAKEDLERSHQQLEKVIEEGEKKRAAISRQYKEEKAMIDQTIQKLATDLQGERHEKAERQKQFKDLYEHYKAEIRQLNDARERERLESEKRFQMMLTKKSEDDELLRILKEDIDSLKQNRSHTGVNEDPTLTARGTRVNGQGGGSGGDDPLLRASADQQQQTVVLQQQMRDMQAQLLHAIEDAKAAKEEITAMQEKKKRRGFLRRMFS